MVLTQITQELLFVNGRQAIYDEISSFEGLGGVLEGCGGEYHLYYACPHSKESN